MARVKDLDQAIAQSNELIRHGRNELTTLQKKILVTAISKIKPTDPYGTKYEISISELCKVLGYQRSGKVYADIVASAKALRDNSVWLPELGNPKRERAVAWLNEVTVDHNKGTLEILFDKDIEGHLFELVNRNIPYTQYQLETAMLFSNKYTLELYEYLLSYIGGNKKYDRHREIYVDIKVEDFRHRFIIESEKRDKHNLYTRWYDVKKYIIDRAVEEINKYSDKIRVSYTYTREGNKPKGKPENITFLIRDVSYDMILSLRAKQKAKLEGMVTADQGGGAEQTTGKKEDEKA